MSLDDLRAEHAAEIRKLCEDHLAEVEHYSKLVAMRDVEIARLHSMIYKLESDRGFYENEIDARRLLPVSDVETILARLAVIEPVYEAAKAWSESFGELSKRLPPHVHVLRDAVDAAFAAEQKERDDG